jgi:hypothetical protein
MLGEDKDSERRRKKYKYALVEWNGEIGNWEDYPKLAIEHKDVLNQWWSGSHKVICDDRPYKVLKGMLKLLKEK